MIQIGVREKDPPEVQLLQESGIKQIPTVALAELPEVLRQLGTNTVYVHVDLDVIDTSEGRANGWACGGGLSLNQLRDALELIGCRASIVAGAVTCYDPAVDTDGRIGRAIPRIVELLAQLGTSRSSRHHKKSRPSCRSDSSNFKSTPRDF